VKAVPPATGASGYDGQLRSSAEIAAGLLDGVGVEQSGDPLVELGHHRGLSEVDGLRVVDVVGKGETERRLPNHPDGWGGPISGAVPSV
jgi:hypothetical protein